jgi:two-component system NtrC family sensor kinase
MDKANPVSNRNAPVTASPQCAADTLMPRQLFDAHPVAAFAIDRAHQVTHWNRACERLLGWPVGDMLGTSGHRRIGASIERAMLSDLIVAADTDALAAYTPLADIPGAFEAEDFFPGLGTAGHWLRRIATPLRSADGAVVGAIESLVDITERRIAEDALRRRYIELAELNGKLSMAQQQLVQSEKLASIGQLAAGVAHEINNPIGYIFSNFGTLDSYLAKLFELLAAYEAAEPAIDRPDLADKVRGLRTQIDLDYLREDIPALMRESKEGITRVRHIVQDLKDFSRLDTDQEWLWASLHRGIDSTLNIVSNEVRYRADVVKQYGELPDIECLPLQLNQVIMNLVVNAAQAIQGQRGRITVRTGAGGEQVWLEVSDNGCGIAPADLSRLFDPFFTTKPVGQGTGLGLSLAYSIVQKHHGRIDVDSKLGRGTTFRVTLPVRQQADNEGAPHE